MSITFIQSSEGLLVSPNLHQVEYSVKDSCFEELIDYCYEKYLLPVIMFQI